MKIRILFIACVTTSAALLAACTAVYKNSDACEQLMRGKLAETTSDTLKIDHTGVGIDGSRVVVEGSINHMQTDAEVAASEVEVASAAAAASAASAAEARRVAKVARAASAASAVSGASAAFADTAVAASGASASVASSGVDAVAHKPVKPKTLKTAAAAECTFHGSTLDVFSWLAPRKLAEPTDAASEATE